MSAQRNTAASKLKVYVSNQQKDLTIKAADVKKIAQAVVAKAQEMWHEVNIHFVDDSTMCRMHAEYFDDPSPTDCISFPVDLDDDEEEPLLSGTDDAYRVMGDVFVCPKTAITWALENQANAYEETTLYILHGLLHLMGYDDIEVNDRRKMRKAEKEYMAHLQLLDLCLKPPNMLESKPRS